MRRCLIAESIQQGGFTAQALQLAPPPSWCLYNTHPRPTEVLHCSKCSLQCKGSANLSQQVEAARKPVVVNRPGRPVTFLQVEHHHCIEAEYGNADTACRTHSLRKHCIAVNSTMLAATSRSRKARAQRSSLIVTRAIFAGTSDNASDTIRRRSTDEAAP